MRDEAHLAFTDAAGGDDQSLFIFDLDSGFTELGDLATDISDGASYVAPRGYHSEN